MVLSDKYKIKLEYLNKAFYKLKNAKTLNYDFDINVEIASKRFEYTFESLWKVIKLYLFESKGVNCYSPMDCFKSAFQVGLIPKNLENTVISMLRRRNDIVHIYNEETAKEIYDLIINHYIEAIEVIVKNLETE